MLTNRYAALLVPAMLGACALNGKVDLGRDHSTGNDGGAGTTGSGGATGSAGSAGAAGASGAANSGGMAGSASDGASGTAAASGSGGTSGDSLDAGGDGGPTFNPMAFVEIRAGYQHTCARRAGGTIVCWGDNGANQIGDGTRVSPQPPTAVLSIDSAVFLDVGRTNACIVSSSGQVSCWGELFKTNTYEYVPSPRLMPGAGSAVEVTNGSNNSCVRHPDGRASCWGQGSSGQLGNGVAMDSESVVPVIGTNAVFDRIAAGFQVTCGLRSGVAYCWGMTFLGSLGDGNTTSLDPRSAMGPPVAMLADVVDLDVSDEGLACAVRSNGTVWCWGPDFDQALGEGPGHPESCHGPTPCSRKPVQVIGINDAIKVATGSHHTCALSAGGTVSCWGLNADGQLGDGATHATCPRGDCSPVPVKVAGVSDAVAITAGRYHTCAIREQGHSIVCWGQNEFAQLGTRPLPDLGGPNQTTPAHVLGLERPDPPLFIPGGVTRAQSSQSCVWDGTSPRPSRDCIGDLYTYTGPSCSMEWTQCGTPGEVWRLDCGADGTTFKCQCIANGHSVGSVGLAIDPCEPRSAPVNGPGPRLHGRMMEIAAQCPFCANPT